MKSLSTLSAFVAVASAGSFADGANQLGLSKSATSKAVARLEEELRVKLLNRTTRSISLTPEGARFLEGARRLLGELDALTDEITASLGEPRGLLRVSAPVGLGRLKIVPIIADLSVRFPRLEIDLSLEDRIVDLAADGIDVSIRSGSLEGSANLIARHLFDDALVTVAAPLYLEQHGIPQTPADLRGHNCLNFRNQRTGRIVPWMFSDEGDVEKYELSGHLTVDDATSIAALTLAGGGISQMPYFLAKEGLWSVINLLLI